MTGNCSDCGATAEYPSLYAGMKLHCKSCPYGWITLPPKTPVASTSAAPISPPVPLSKFTIPESTPYVPAKKPEPPGTPAPFVARRATENDPDGTALPPPVAESLALYQLENRTDYAMQEVSRALRLAARLIDFAFIFAALMMGVMITMKVLKTSSSEPGWNTRDMFKAIYFEDSSGAVVYGPLILVMVFNVILISVRGQSLGKMILGIEIVRYGTGTTVGFLRGFLLRDGVSILINQIPFVNIVYRWVNPLMIFGQQRRCLHDYIAGTAVAYRP